MNIINSFIYWIAAVTAVALAVVEIKRCLMMMQQNSYRPERYMRWLRSSGDTTSVARLIGLAVALFALVTFTAPVASAALIGLFAIIQGGNILSRERGYKKPLVWTARAKRIFAVAVVLVILLTALVAVMTGGVPVTGSYWLAGVAVGGILVYCASHVVILASVWILKPVEKRINQHYYDDAARILAAMPSLKVIGITGSYGKTSTKHYLHTILSSHFETLMTPGSYNTTMGVIRTVREMMKPYTEVFICEMGAKQRGDIEEICRLVHPSIGIITAVGPMHLETFHSIENVQRTKFELIDSLPKDGFAVINDDFEYCANRPVADLTTMRYTANDAESAQYKACDIEYSAEGTVFTIICPDGHTITLRTRLVGECNVSNLTAAVIVALHLGVPEEKIRQSVARIQQVEHRLSMTRTHGGVTIIDDAFNSNPDGSRMALDVLRAMKGGRRIIVTPGMIELGDKQYELNRRYGENIATAADLAIIVGEYNREAITEGIRAGAFAGELMEFGSFAEAQRWLNTSLRSGDIVLYENDLPDTFK